MAALTVLTSFFDCVLSRCMVANAKTELWLWSKMFAEGSSASVLISTTTVLWNMNLSPLCIITRERHPPLFWPLWDNVAHTIIMDLHAHRYTRTHSVSLLYTKSYLCLSLSFSFRPTPNCIWSFLSLVSVIGLFMWFPCQWETSAEIWPYYKNRPLASHIHDRKGRHASKTKVYTSLYN